MWDIFWSLVLVVCAAWTLVTTGDSFYTSVRRVLRPGIDRVMARRRWQGQRIDPQQLERWAQNFGKSVSFYWATTKGVSACALVLFIHDGLVLTVLRKSGWEQWLSMSTSVLMFCFLTLMVSLARFATALAEEFHKRAVDKHSVEDPGSVNEPPPYSG